MNWRIRAVINAGILAIWPQMVLWEWAVSMLQVLKRMLCGDLYKAFARLPRCQPSMPRFFRLSGAFWA